MVAKSGRGGTLWGPGPEPRSAHLTTADRGGASRGFAKKCGNWARAHRRRKVPVVWQAGAADVFIIHNTPSQQRTEVIPRDKSSDLFPHENSMDIGRSKMKTDINTGVYDLLVDIVRVGEMSGCASHHAG
jgi:hypothetical protein